MADPWAKVCVENGVSRAYRIFRETTDMADARGKTIRLLRELADDIEARRVCPSGQDMPIMDDDEVME